jgi:hypothetical protein
MERGHPRPPGEIFRSRQSTHRTYPAGQIHKAPDSLKLELQTELDLPLGVGDRLGDGRTSGCIRKSSAAASATGSHIRKVEVRVVEDVK